MSVTGTAVGVQQEKQRLGVNTVRLGCPGLGTYQGTDKELSHLSEFLEQGWKVCRVLLKRHPPRKPSWTQKGIGWSSNEEQNTPLPCKRLREFKVTAVRTFDVKSEH